MVQLQSQQSVGNLDLSALVFLSFSLHLSDSVGGRMLCIPLRE